MENKKIIPWLNHGITLTLIPIVGLIIAYVFEVGYLSYYGVPHYLIKLDINQIFVGVFLTILFISLVIISIAYIAHLTTSPSFWTRVFSSALQYCFLIFLLMLLVPNKDINKYLLFSILFTLNIGACYFEEKQNLKKTIVEKEDKSSSLENKETNNLDSEYQLQDKFFKKISASLKTFVFTLVLLLLIIHQLGYRIAESKAMHWVTSDDNKTFLVAMYGDMAIFKKVDDSNVLLDDVIIKKIGESDPTKMKRVKFNVYNSFSKK